nr:MAG TPA: hypothetical protein [Caudoviricetes sp.]
MLRQVIVGLIVRRRRGGNVSFRTSKVLMPQKALPHTL